LSINLLILGPQGAGKGTQAKKISAEYGLPHVSTGDMLRDHMTRGTELGERVRPIYDAGELVPDDLMIELIRDRLSRGDTVPGFVLDGFPRTLPQAEALAEMFRGIRRDLDAVLVLEVDEDEAVRRLNNRAAEEGRSDDTPEVIRTRLDNYRVNTAPLVEWYRARDKVVPIDGDGPADEVFDQIRRALTHLGSRARVG
jgi:adenylate kinase